MTLSNQGYFRSPTVYQDQVVFLCEDDLWQVPLQGGKAYRLTNARSVIHSPVFSPDGQWIACCSREEGEHDVYMLPAEGGPLKRLTFLNTVLYVIGWTRDGKSIIFRSAHQAFHRTNDAWLYQVSLEGGPIQRLEIGPATYLSWASKGKGRVIGRNAINNSYWKRYQGGTSGELWIDVKGDGSFKPLLPDLKGNPIRPQWIHNRIYFISDHEGIGNLYSCQTNGQDLQKESDQQEFYARDTNTDENHILFQSGGRLFGMSIKTKETFPISIQWHSPQTQTQRKFFYGEDYLEYACLHPQGHSLALTARGKLFSMPFWEKASVQYGPRDGVRHRLTSWLHDERLVTISDQAQKVEQLAVFASHPSQKPERLIKLPPGRVQSLGCSPTKNEITLSTNRLELYLLDIDKGKFKKLDQSSHYEIRDVIFSPDGKWLAYSKSISSELTAIFLLNLASKKIHQITQPIRFDFCPAFDPDGKWIYFLSSRTYNPTWDTVQFAATFSRSIKPYLITLKNDIMSPFLPEPHTPGKDSNQDEQEKNSSEKKDKSDKKSEDKESKKESKAKPLEIDFENIENRIIEFPVNEGLYGQIMGLPNKALFTEFPVSGDFDKPNEGPEEDEGILWAYDFDKLEVDQLASNVGTIQITPSAKTLMYRTGNMLRVLEAGVAVPEEESTAPSRKSGWLDLRRIRISINYPAEWQQMFQEAWRLQKEFFWREDLSGVDWQAVYQRYAPLVSHLGARSELSDLIWEMQGELATSHTYEWGGDYPYSPKYHIGQLGADLEYAPRQKGYVIQRLYQGDVWKKGEHSPLCEPGLLISEGDVIVAIGGIPVDEKTTPNELMVHQAGQDVLLSIKPKQKKAEIRHITVKTLHFSQRVRYRDWVKRCTQQVNNATNGQIGYLHIPDMSSGGIAEFHRGYLAQTDKKGLILDVRYNGGGNVSSLILEKLAHRHLGFDIPRWGASESYPYHTVQGPLVAITNEFCGSDGDMFCHSFKTLKLGTLIGKRTWGGVIGIDGRYQLVDGTTTTQPQYAIWFHNEGWSVENRGVDPDIEVAYPPQAYVNGSDPQLEVAIKEILKLLEKEPPSSPTLPSKPKTSRKKTNEND